MVLFCASLGGHLRENGLSGGVLPVLWSDKWTPVDTMDTGPNMIETGLTLT